MIWLHFIRFFPMVNKFNSLLQWLTGKKTFPLNFLFIHLSILRSSTEHKLSWKVPYIFDGSGTLSATVMINPSNSNGTENEHGTRPSSNSPVVHIQFLAENALFSGIEFEFAGRGYRLSLLKKKICSGKSPLAQH